MFEKFSEWVTLPGALPFENRNASFRRFSRVSQRFEVLGKAMQVNHKTLGLLVFCVASLSVALYLAHEAGYRINVTPGFPRGIYKVLDRPIARGDLVWSCPPQVEAVELAKLRSYLSPGACQSDYSPILKRVVAMGWDKIAINWRGVSVNGLDLPNTMPMVTDSEGREMPRLNLRITLVSGQILLISEYHAQSFDSRYFGPVALENVQGVAEPILTE